MASTLPSVFDPFKVNYSGSDKQWDIATLIASEAKRKKG